MEPSSLTRFLVFRRYLKFEGTNGLRRWEYIAMCRRVVVNDGYLDDAHCRASFHYGSLNKHREWETQQVLRSWLDPATVNYVCRIWRAEAFKRVHNEITNRIGWDVGARVCFRNGRGIALRHLDITQYRYIFTYAHVHKYMLVYLPVYTNSLKALG